MQRKTFLKNTLLAAAGATCLPIGSWMGCSNARKSSGTAPDTPLFFKISLAQWSLHRTLRSGKLNNLDFPAHTKRVFGIDAVEYVNQFFKDKAKDKSYLTDLRTRCDGEGVRSVLIMCDGEGWLGDADPSARQQAVENHYKWVEAAQFLGCFCIRVNAGGHGSAEEVAQRSVESLQKLSAFGEQHGIAVIVENHGGYSSNGKWLADVIQRVGMKNCGTLPDFGNFCLRRSEDYKQCFEWYDRYVGVKELMPFAKDVSAKTYDFDSVGNCIETDYYKMLKIVHDAGFRGHIGIEYEGNILSEEEGIKKTLALLKKVGKTMGS